MLPTHVSTDVLHTIAIRARSLPECLYHLETHGSADQIDDHERPDIERRLELWCQIVAKGDWQKFQRRLAWDGLTLETARLLVSNATQTRSPNLPDWVHTLAQIIDAAQTQHRYPPETAPRALNSERPIPFEDFYLPALQVAQRSLAQSLTVQLGRQQGDEPIHEWMTTHIADAAQIALERQLLNSLAFLCAPTLIQKFIKFRSSGSALRDFLIITIQGASSRDRYHAFLHLLMQDGLLAFFEQYSVLGRLMVTLVDHWATATAELFTCLIADWAAIEQQFSPHQPLSQVIAIEPGRSDSHRGGRSVAILTFDTGLKLVYKPKNLSLEVAFGQLVDWCNQQGMPLELKVPHILNRSTYGWAEFISTLPCQNEAAVHRFYQRSGMLLCLIHVLEGTDCHYENLIAHGEYPVLIDMETLLHPQIKQPESGQSIAIDQLAQAVTNSVLKTALLPVKDLSVINELVSLDMSGLGKVEEQVVTSLAWKHINTDGMTVEVNHINLIPEANVPLLNSVAVASDRFVEAIADGFEQMYRWLLHRQSALLAAQSPLMVLAQRECRLVFRHTRIYGTILMRSYSPELMQMGMARSAALDVLSRAFLVSSEKPHYWAMLSDELRAMEQLDIPMFTADTSSLDLPLSTGMFIHNLCESSGIERVLAHVKAMNEADLMFQRQMIQLSLCSRFLQEPQLPAIGAAPLTPPKGAAVATPSPLSVGVLLTSDHLLNAALDVAHILRQQALVIDAPEPGLLWLGTEYLHQSQAFYIQNGGFNLYDGSCGIALFLGALAQVSHRTEWRESALASLYPVRQLLKMEPQSMQRVANKLGIGGGIGLGSMVYALTHLSQWLDQPQLLDEALQVTALITPERIAADRVFDLVGGAAGTILGLLPLLHRVEGESHSTVLRVVTAAAHQLLEQQVWVDGQPQAWKTWRDRQLTGFSQGAAGIAYALLQLFAVTQDERYHQAALAALAYEQTQFSPEAKNWLDLRSPIPRYQVSWAHGAAGIALARLGSLSILDTPEVRQDVAIGLETTQQHLVWGVDSICWGNGGRIETLLVAAQALHRPDLLALAHQATATVLAQHQTQAGFNLFYTLSDPVSTRVIHPGLFHGLSGIGYQLLRLAYPDQLPSILLWQ